MATWQLGTLIKLYEQEIGIGRTETESPMEELFLQEAKNLKLEGVTCQYQIGPYRVDFAIEKEKTAIEVDGRNYHSTVDQILKDYCRQKEIERMGWTVVRFTGSEVWNETRICVQKVRNAIALKKINLRRQEMLSLDVLK